MRSMKDIIRRIGLGAGAALGAAGLVAVGGFVADKPAQASADQCTAFDDHADLAESQQDDAQLDFFAGCGGLL